MSRRAILLAVLLACTSVLVGAKPGEAVTRTAARATTPSGIAAPKVSLPGWRLDFVDDFTTGSLGPAWFGYGGTPGGDPAGHFATSHLRITGGMLQIRGYRDANYGGKFTTGGISSHQLARTYGKWLVRFRMDAGQGVAYALLLWPEKDAWPPEIDFAEDNGVAKRPVTTATLHYRTSRNPHGAVRATKNVVATQWHTVGVEWLPNHLTYTLDGKPWAQMSGRNVPRVPMRLAIQTQAWGCGNTWERCPNSTTPKRVDLDVDWVAAYRPA